REVLAALGLGGRCSGARRRGHESVTPAISPPHARGKSASSVVSARRPGCPTGRDAGASTGLRSRIGWTSERRCERVRPKRIVTVDIETIPAPYCEVGAEAGGARRTKRTPEEAHRRTALQPEFGRVLCVGYIDERGGRERTRGCIGFDERTGRFEPD